MDKEKQKELQENYLHLQLIDQQIKQLQQQLQTFDNRVTELAVTMDALENLKDTKIGTKLLVPISAGIFVSAELKENKKLQVNVGGDVNVTKTLPDTKKLIEDQIDEIQKYRDQIFLQLHTLVGKAQEIENKISKFAK